MAKNPTAKRDEQHEVTRRALIKWSVAAGAALGVSRSKIFEILERTAGKGTAAAAAEHATTRSIHITDGNGGLANYTLLWPYPDIALAKNPQFSWHKIGTEQSVTPTNGGKLVVGGDTPFAAMPAARQMTVFMAGNNETHTGNPTSTFTLNNNGIYAVASALQSSAPSTIPVVTVGNTRLGTAPGAATAAAVGNADGIVGLFNSAASRMGGLLAKSTDAGFYKAYYDGFIQLNRAANRSTTKTSYLTAGGAAQFLGTNLAAKLAVTNDDLTRYGITGNTRANVAAMGRTFITAIKSFKAGLTNAIVMPGMGDDPHGRFDSGEVNTVPAQMKLIFDGLMNDLNNTVDDSTNVTLANDTVITIIGDTPKQGTQRSGWPDGSANNHNLIFVYSAGHLKSGWYGNLSTGNVATGFNAAGQTTGAYNGPNQAKMALASVAYAIAKRDDRAIANFATGVTVAGVFGNLKDK